MDIGFSGRVAVVTFIPSRVVNIGLRHRVDQARICGKK